MPCYSNSDTYVNLLVILNAAICNNETKECVGEELFIINYYYYYQLMIKL